MAVGLHLKARVEGSGMLPGQPPTMCQSKQG